MTRCPWGPLLGDLVLGLLRAEEAQALDRHLDGCAPCRHGLAEHLALWLLEPVPVLAARASHTARTL